MCSEIVGAFFALPASAPSVLHTGNLQLYGCLQRIPWQHAVKNQPVKITLWMEEWSHLSEITCFLDFMVLSPEGGKLVASSVSALV